MVDWVTIGAQIVNFIILVVLLKIFLYDRVLEAMDKRKARVEGQFEQASRKKSEAENEAQEYRQKRRELDDQREKLLQQARKDAEQARRERRTQAEEEVRRLKQQWVQSVEDQRADFVSDLRRQTARQLGDLASKVLDDLADASLQQQVVAAFLQRVRDLDEDARRDFREVLSTEEKPLEVAAAFDIDQDQAGQIRDAIQALSEDEADIRFVKSSDLICGIQLRAGGRAVGWNVAEYVEELVDQIGETIDGKIRELRGERGDQPEAEGESNDDSHTRQNGQSGKGNENGERQSSGEGGRKPYDEKSDNDE
jgi:F-type H+-transporting ATPase subunit b